MLPPKLSILAQINSFERINQVGSRSISSGVKGAASRFHSPVDPDIIDGAYGWMQRSEDGSHNWSIVGPLPADLISLAASARDVDTLYAGTRGGHRHNSNERQLSEPDASVPND
jgi:hypothetical protein